MITALAVLPAAALGAKPVAQFHDHFTESILGRAVRNPGGRHIGGDGQLRTGEFISSEITLNKGPHPEAESDFALFCEVVSEALS